MDKIALDAAITDLQAHKHEWARLPVGEKIALLKQVRANTGRLAARWVEELARAAQIPPNSPWVGEEWVTGPWAFLAGINGLLDTLEKIARGEKPRPKKVFTRPDGQVVAKVFPYTIFDWLLLNAFSAEVWMEPGITPENLPGNMAVFYDQPNPDGRVALVLGAGNVSSIVVLDILFKLFTEGQVTLAKLSHVKDYLLPVFEEIWQPFISRGYLRLVHGEAEVGSYLAYHDGVEEVHITGSIHSHDAIVFGAGEEGQRRKQVNDPLLKKRMTSELGGVSPTIIVPGPWSDVDIRYQAEHITTLKFHHSGFNCISSQVLVMAEGWDRGSQLIGAVQDLMRRLPPRHAYYPGAAERQKKAIAAHPGAFVVENGQVPRTMVTGLDPNNSDEIFYNYEFFAPVLGQTALPGSNPAEFLKNAVRFANETLFGTLGVTILIHPQTIKEIGGALDQAIADLQYGGIGVNAWDAGVFLLAQCAWGAYPGHPLNDVASGIGVVHNSLMFAKSQKTVAYGSFYPYPRSWLHGDFHLSPRPLWFVTNKTAATTARRVTQFAADPGWRHIPGIFESALRGIFL